MPSTSDDDHSQEINVPITGCPLLALSFDMLQQQIDPLAACNDYGIDLYMSLHKGGVTMYPHIVE